MFDFDDCFFSMPKILRLREFEYKHFARLQKGIMTNWNCARSHLFLQFIIKRASFLPSHILWLSQEVLRIFVSQSVEIKFSANLAQGGTVMRRYDMCTYSRCSRFHNMLVVVEGYLAHPCVLIQLAFRVCSMEKLCWFRSPLTAEPNFKTVHSSTWILCFERLRQYLTTLTADVAWGSFQRNKVPRKVEVGLSGGSHAQIPPWRPRIHVLFPTKCHQSFPKPNFGIFLVPKLNQTSQMFGDSLSDVRLVYAWRPGALWFNGYPAFTIYLTK